MFEQLILITLLVLACISVFSDNLRRSIIFLGSFSLVIALAYLYYNAPDVALAEAAIGVGLSTIMYLIALKKVSVYDICYIDEAVEDFNDDQIYEVKNSIIKPLELFIERTEEIEPQIAYTNHSLKEIMEDERHDFIIQKKGNLTYLYGDTTDDIYQDIIANMNDIIPDISDVRIVFRDQEVNLDV